MPDDYENRISKLEAYRETDVESIDHIKGKVDTIDENVQEIKSQLARHKGFIAGAMFVITPIWLLLVSLGREMWTRFSQ